MKCKNHGFHKSIEWGWKFHIREESVEDAHMVVKSLMNCSSALHDQARLDDFLLRVLRFRRSGWTAEDLQSLWKRLGVSERMLPFYVRADIWWKGRLVVRGAVVGRRPAVLGQSAATPSIWLRLGRLE